MTDLNDSAAHIYRLRCKLCDEYEGPRKEMRIITCEGACSNHYHVKCAKLPPYSVDIIVNHARNITFKCDSCVGKPISLTDVIKLLTQQQSSIAEISKRMNAVDARVNDVLSVITSGSDSDSESVSEVDIDEDEVNDLLTEKSIEVDQLLQHPQNVEPSPSVIPTQPPPNHSNENVKVSNANSNSKKRVVDNRRKNGASSRNPRKKLPKNSKPKHGNRNQAPRVNNRRLNHRSHHHANPSHQNRRPMRSFERNSRMNSPHQHFHSPSQPMYAYGNPFAYPAYSSCNTYAIPPLVIDNRNPNFHVNRQPDHFYHNLGHPSLH